MLTVQHGVTSSLRSVGLQVSWRVSVPDFPVSIRPFICGSLFAAVGLQVWKAAMLLTDFVLHKSFTTSEFDDVTAMEIGAGTGDGSI